MKYMVLSLFLSLTTFTVFVILDARDSAKQMAMSRNLQIEANKLLKQQNAYLKSAVKEKRVVVYTCGEKFDIMGIEGKNVFIVPKNNKNNE